MCSQSVESGMSKPPQLLSMVCAIGEFWSGKFGLDGWRLQLRFATTRAREFGRVGEAKKLGVTFV